MAEAGVSKVSANRVTRALFFVLGWAFFALGILGIFLPVLSTTGPMILAAACFARSSPRFEAWLLALPTIGPMIADYRNGLGMAKRTKIYAITMMVLVAGISGWWLRERPVMVAAVVVLIAAGITYIAARVPTREDVLPPRGE